MPFHNFERVCNKFSWWSSVYQSIWFLPVPWYPIAQFACLGWYWENNRPVAQIPQCTSHICHNATFYDRNVLLQMVHFGIFVQCIVVFVRWVHCDIQYWGMWTIAGAPVLVLCPIAFATHLKIRDELENITFSPLCAWCNFSKVYNPLYFLFNIDGHYLISFRAYICNQYMTASTLSRLVMSKHSTSLVLNGLHGMWLVGRMKEAR